MNTRVLVFGLIAAMMILPLITFAGGFQLNEHGARAMAVGGAFVARASDPSALFFNPAGMSQLRGTQIMAGTTLIMPSFKFRGPTNYNVNTEVKMADQVFTPINFYATHTFDGGTLDGLAIGLGVYNPYGLGTKWDDNWVGKTITQETKLTTFFFSPTVSYAINDMISVGAGASYVLGDVKLRQAVTLFDPAMNLDLEGDGNGFGWNASILVKPIDLLSVGFCYRSSVKLDLEGTAKFSNQTTSMAALFPGGDVKTSIELPSTFFAGIAFFPMDNLEIEVDYQGTGWSSYKQLDIDFVNDATTDPNKVIKQADVSSPKNYEDSYIIRAGVEYNLVNAGLKLRGGFLYDKNPVPDAHVEPLLPDANRQGISFGLGYKVMPSLTIDASYLFLSFAQRTTTATSFDTRPTGGTDYGVYFDGTYNGSTHLIAIDFTYSL